jgi:hypothetical protein
MGAGDRALSFWFVFVRLPSANLSDTISLHFTNRKLSGWLTTCASRATFVSRN